MCLRPWAPGPAMSRAQSGQLASAGLSVSSPVLLGTGNKPPPCAGQPDRAGSDNPQLGDPHVITMARGWEESVVGEPVLGRPAVGPGDSELGRCPSPACPPTPIRVSWAETVQDAHGDNTAPGTQRLFNSRDRAELRPEGASSGGARRVWGAGQHLHLDERGGASPSSRAGLTPAWPLPPPGAMEPTQSHPGHSTSELQPPCPHPGLSHGPQQSWASQERPCPGQGGHGRLSSTTQPGTTQPLTAPAPASPAPWACRCPSASAGGRGPAPL